MSAERDLSLRGGESVSAAFKRRGYCTEIADLTKVYDASELRRYGAVFVCLHGPGGEDGSGCKLIPDEVLSKGATETSLELAVMVKDPQKPQSASSRGVWRCEAQADVPAAGRTWSSASSKGLVLPIMEFKTDLLWQNLASKNALWDWDGLAANSKTIEKVCPATSLHSSALEMVRSSTLAIYEWLGCRGALNVEFRVDAQGTAFFVGVSSIPAMTPTSVHAACAAAAGISFDRVCETILLAATTDKNALDSLEQKL
ncbi:hypothetical protein M885DRAFT_561399 [Pelagophyceae sp. CCMP2097]|nr:hypothetical protein M885DRAFT_561399 [Pelagophyceae sp. CCMP2097]